MSNDLALAATSHPILPNPMIPSFLFQSSVPVSFFFSQRSSFMELSAWVTFLAKANMSEKTISATETVGASGVFWTSTPFALAAFWGEYGGKRYPESYTEAEREFIRPFLGDIDRAVYHLKGESPKGKLCNAGYKYAVIQADGKVIRCGQLADGIISNIMDEDFHLLDKPEPCQADYCPCNEYINLSEETN